MFERLGVQAFRLRFLIVIVWVVLAVLSVRFAPSIASSGAADQAAFLPSYTPSVLATEALEKAFPGSSASSSAVLTFSREGGLTDADRAYLEDVAAWTKSADAPDELRNAVISVDSATSRPELASMLRSADGVLELLTVNLSVGSAGGEADTIVTQLRDHLASAPAGLETHVTGAAGITTDYIRAIESGTDSTTLVTVILVVIILLLIYRAPLAALVPLLTIGAAFAVARGVLGVLAAAGWQVSSLLDTFLVVLVFGVGTDYAIFLISRYREEVRHEGWHEAVRDTVKRIGAVISASAATVIVGLAAMAFADFEMIRSTGPALGVAVFITLLAGLTLTPALLGIFGHYLFWPLHMRTVGDGEPDGFFARLATGVSHHPGVVTVVLTVVLAIPILYVPQAKTNFDTLAELPASSDARAGYDIVAAHLGKGRITQSTALIDTAGAGDMLTPASLARLRDTVLALDATPGVDTVTSLVTPNGDGVVPDGLRPSKQLGTIADELDAKDGGAAADTSALLDTEVTDGLTSALDYVSALGVAFPDVAGRSEYRAATRAVEDAQAVVENVREQSLLSTQLRTLAAMLTSTSALAGSGGDADTGLIARYLDELAAAYPEVRSLPAYADATAAAADLAKGPSLDAAVAASTALGSLATHFDGRPDATLAPESLAGTEAAREARRKAEETFAALPVAFRDLATVFAGRSDDLFVPVGIGGDRAADIEKAVDAFVSQDRSATRFYVTTTDDPYSIDAFATVRAAQDVLAARAPAFGPGTVSHLGGSTAQLADVQDVLSTDFMRVGIVTVIGILLVLIVLLRALVAPLYLVATVLLSYGSALGLSAFLFQEVLGQNGISFYLPLMVFVLLVSLGADYNIFLMSRVREESEGRPIREGIRIASGRTGAVITSAGLILAGTFGSMATAPLVVLFQVGVAVAIGVLIDTFLVRSILVPAITTLVGDRAWWPSGVRLGDRGIVPAPVADAEDGVLATSAATGRRSRRRLAVALVLAALVPVTFAGLVVWSQSQGGTASTPAAVVVLDEGATVSRADGTTASLALGTDLAAQLVAGTVTDAFRWESVDSAKAQDGLAAGTYGAVLTIPADFSRRVAAIRSDATGGQPAASLDLAVGPGEGAGAAEIAREVRAAITATAARDAAASYVEDVLLAVTAADRTIDTASADARSLADRTSALADDASGIRTVSGELVVGLDELANGATSAVDGVTRLVDGTSALASGTALVADGATAVAAGAKDASTGAAQVSSGADSLSAGLQTLNASTSSLPSQGAQLATGASDLATGATKAASGAGDLATGLGTLQTQTAGLPGQTQQLADGAAQLSTGTTKAAAGAADLATGLGTMQTQTTGLGPQTAALATGAAQLSSGTAQAASGAADLATGLATMQTQTTGLGAQAQALASGASTLATGAAGVSAGATQSAAGAASLAQGADALSGSVAGYTGAIAALSASCIALGGGPVVCGQLAAIAGQGPALATGASDLATGAHGVADGTAQVATGAAGVSQGANDLATGTAAFAAGAPQLEAGIAASAAGAKALADALTALSAGASQLADGTARLAAGMPQLETGIAQAATGSKALADALSALAAGASELAQGTLKLAEGTPQLVSGIAQSADGASQLATGTAAVADGATQLATGTQQLADGMTPLAEGVASAASGASDLAGGAAQLAGGVSDLAAGSTKVASGAEKTASGAATLADGTASAVSSFGQLTDAMSRLVGGARVVESRSGLLADDGSAVSADAARAADGLGGAGRPATPATDATRTAVAERAADPVVVQASASSDTTGSGIAPYVMALALWLGALVAFLVLPAGRRGRGRRWWMGPVGAFVAAAVLGTVGAVLMIAGLRLGVGMDVARLPALIAVAALAAAAFAAIIQALVVAFGDRGWLAGLLFAGVQAAACASPYVVDSLPGPLAFLRPLLPVTWAADAFRACIDGTTAGLATGALLLAGSLAVALLVTLAVAWGSDRPPATAPAPA